MLCVSNMGSDEFRYQVRIAQWVEHRTENTGVAGSIPAPTRVFNPNDRCKRSPNRPAGSEPLSARFYPGSQPGPVGLNANPVLDGITSGTGKGCRPGKTALENMPCSARIPLHL